MIKSTLQIVRTLTKQHIIRIIQMLRSATLIQLEELEVFIRNYLT